MDWIDERFEKLRKKLHNLSLRKSLIVYIIVCILCVVLLSVITFSLCDQWDRLIWSKYLNIELQGYESNIVYYEDLTKLTKMERLSASIIDFLQTWSTFVYSAIGIVIATGLFYNKKLKEPLALLKEATKKLGDNDLDADLFYDNKDEMGELCNSFDDMRKQLIMNYQKTWDMMEEQKRLNAAFAHDLRTPLTVLRGYTDFLNRYIPEGKIKEEKLLSTLTLMSNQIQRLESYGNTMKEISSLEEIPVQKAMITEAELITKLKEVISILKKDKGISIVLSSDIAKGMQFSIDFHLVMEVFENLLSNALRYAKSMIEVNLSYTEEGRHIILSVADDGKGFSAKDLSMATKPYYSDKSENPSYHFGIGLYICKILCQKHGGWISLANQANKGAIVTAIFDIG